MSRHRRLERKKAEKELERYKLIVESLPDGVFAFDLKGNVTSVNNVVLSYGYKKEEVIGKSILEFTPEKYWPMISKQLVDLANGKSTQGEVEIKTKKGTVTAEFRSSPIKKGRKIVGFLSVVRDITRQKLMEEELRESEEKYRLIFENSPDGIITLGSMGNITSVNDVVLRYGYKREELIGKSWLEFIPEKYRPILDEHVADVTMGTSAQGELELNIPKGRLPVWFRGSPIRKRGEIVGFQITLIDITKRKMMEEELRESDERLRNLYESVPDALAVYVGREGRLIEYNKAFKKWSGYADEELKDKTFLDFVHPDDRAMVLERYRTEYSEEELPLVYEIKGLNKKGEIIPTEISVGTYKKKDRVIGINVMHRDITERKQMEEELRESEEKFRNLFESIQDPVGVFVGREGRLIEYNKAFKKTSGYTDEELKDKIFLDFVHPDDQALVLERYKTNYSEEELPLVYEIRAVNKKGKIIPLEISVGTYKKKGRVIGIEIMHRDITERKQMEEELRESEERLRNLYENIPDSLAVYVGREGRLIDYNKAFKEQSGYTDEELKDKTMFDFVHPDDHAMILEKYRTKYPEEELPLVYELRSVVKNGEIIPTEISVGPYKKKGRIIGIEVVHRDITERKEMERKLQEYAEHLEDMVEERTRALRESQERLIKAERLAAIGQLATMVGHDLRNPLSSIQNACYYLKMNLEASKNENVKKMFGIIDKEINHANNIVKDLLDFSRVNKPELKTVDIISSIQDILAQLKIPENITITTKYSEIPTIKADLDQLRRIFQNITLNGVQAMPDGGKLTVSTRKNSDFVEVAFTDTGVGIPEENMEKLFTPLFTTKSQGVGLGLAICKNLVESHNGRIEVKSKVGEGSTFTVKLPIHQTEGGEKQT